MVCAGADEVLACRDERLRQNDAEVYARLICDLVAERKPEAILYGATAFGRELAPGVAVRLQTGLTADCTVLSMDTETGLLQQTRPAFGGNLMATIVCPHHRPQMATVRPGIFKAPDFDYGRSGTITQVALAEDVKARVEISIPAEEWGQQPSIANAERLVVVVAALVPEKPAVDAKARRGSGCRAWLHASPSWRRVGWSIATRLARRAYRFRPGFS